MNELTLESLAKRVETLERLLAVPPSTSRVKDWRLAVGMFTGSEFMKQIDVAGQAIRQSDRDEGMQPTDS